VSELRVSHAASLPADLTTFSWWVRSIIVVGAALLIIGSVIAMVRPIMLVSPHDDINNAARVYAGYFAVRNFALGIALLVFLILRARAALAGLISLTAVIQILDAAMDVLEQRWAVLPEVIILALLFLLVAVRLSGHSFWKTAG
jgi:hypothetical protein